MDYEDFITVEQENIRVIFEPDIMDFLRDKNYSPVITAFLRGPLTVKQLVEKYEEITGDKKSDKTMYRYLKEFEKRDLIIPVGQRVTRGKKATETLYGRTAKVFYFYQSELDYWNSDETKEESEILLKTLSDLLSKSLDVPKPNTDCLRRIMIKNDVFIPTNIDRIMGIYIEESGKETHEFSVPEVFRLINFLRSVLPLIIGKEFFEEELKECFPSKYKK